MVLGTPGSLDHTVGTAALEEDMQLKKPKMLIKWKDAQKKKKKKTKLLIWDGISGNLKSELKEFSSVALICSAFHHLFHRSVFDCIKFSKNSNWFLVLLETLVDV